MIEREGAVLILLRFSALGRTTYVLVGDASLIAISSLGGICLAVRVMRRFAVVSTAHVSATSSVPVTPVDRRCLRHLALVPWHER